MIYLKHVHTSTHDRKAIFVSSQLTGCSYVFIHNARVTPSLHPLTYLGLFVVKQHTDKYLILM